MTLLLTLLSSLSLEDPSEDDDEEEEDEDDDSLLDLLFDFLCLSFRDFFSFLSFLSFFSCVHDPYGKNKAGLIELLFGELYLFVPFVRFFLFSFLLLMV